MVGVWCLWPNLVRDLRLRWCSGQRQEAKVNLSRPQRGPTFNTREKVHALQYPDGCFKGRPVGVMTHRMVAASVENIGGHKPTLILALSLSHR